MVLPRICGVASAMAVCQISLRLVGRLVERSLASDRLEVRVADLDADRGGLEAGRAQAPGDALGEGQQGALELLGDRACRR